VAPVELVDYIERGTLRGLNRIDRKIPPALLERSKPSIRAWHAPVSAADVVYPEQIFRPKNPGSPGKKRERPKNDSGSPGQQREKSTSMTQLTLTARALKITVPLDPAEVRALHIPDNQTRAQLVITCEGKVYTADIATKALRKAKGTIAANRVENVFAMVQGKLKGNNEIVECGLVAQVKAVAASQPTPAPSAPATSGSGLIPSPF
jgi:hypothetical protein